MTAVAGRPAFAAIAPAVAGIAGFILLWEVVGRSGIGGSALPQASAVAGFLADTANRSLLVRAALATLRSAATGYGIGALLGLVLAGIGIAYPRLRTGSDRANAWLHAIPMIALGPIFVIALGVERAPAAMAAFSVIFGFYAAATSGAESVSPAHADLLTVLGATPLSRFRHLSLPAAVPMLVVGLKLAVPRAFIGAILGEWFGAPRGLGVLMATAMQEARIPLLWSAVVVATTLSLALFTLGAGAERAARRAFQ